MKFHNRIRNAAGLRRARTVLGFTLIELMIAVTILMSALLLTLGLVNQGIGRMHDALITSDVKECARLTMEYLSTLPPDVIYGMSPGTAQTSTFALASGDNDLVNFVNDSYPICRRLSDGGTGIGNKVQLRYTLCPGCQAHENPVYTGFVTCIYFFKLRLTYNAAQYGGANKHIDYAAKLYAGQAGDCDAAVNPNACGAGPTMPDGLDNCSI